MQLTATILAALAAAPVVLGQTYTTCNPMNTTCTPDTGLQEASFTSDFTKGKSAEAGWTVLPGTTLTYGSKGAEFTIAKVGQAPTISTNFTFFFGTLEVTMQAAPGQGIVSSIVLESADLDEVDWEFIGSDTGHVQSNYYGKGNTTTYNRVVYHPISSPQTTVHTYKLDWNQDRIIYYIDGSAVRTLNYADANGGSNFPQTPMHVKLGNWAGGAPDSPQGTAEWAGGRTDYSDGPFTMYVQSVKVTNLNPAKEYVWTDKSGSYQSIKSVAADGKDSFATTASGVSNKNNNGTDSSATSSSSSSSKASATATPKTPVIRPSNSTINGTSTTMHTSTTTKASSTSTHSSTSSRTSAASTPTSSTTTNAASSASPMVGGLVLLFTLAMCSWML